MQDSFSRVITDPVFRKHAVALGKSMPVVEPLSFDPILAQMQRFASARRREVRIALLHDSGRGERKDWKEHRELVPEAVSAFVSAVKMISDQANVLRPLITPKLDAAIALASSEEHPLHTLILEKTLSLGFSQSEAAWLFGELKGLKHRPVEVVCADGFDDLLALLAGVSVGEGGLLLAGFVRFTEDPETDKRIENIVIRLRERGVTASFFLVLIIMLTANAVAACGSSDKAASTKARKGRASKG